MKIIINAIRLRLHKGGFSLVELLISALITLLIVYTVITLTGRGDRISVNTNHRETARTLLISNIESSQWDESNYTALLAGGVTVTPVTIDGRGTTGTTDDLKGTISVQHVFVDKVSGNIATPYIPYILVRAKISWNELEGVDSLVLERLICKIN